MVNSDDLYPTKICITKKQEGITRTLMSVTFELGFSHTLEYERHDRGFGGGDVIIRLDGKELMREGLASTAFRRTSLPFDIEGQPIGLITIQGVVVALFVNVTVNGVTVLTF